MANCDAMSRSAGMVQSENFTRVSRSRFTAQTTWPSSTRHMEEPCPEKARPRTRTALLTLLEHGVSSRFVPDDRAPAQGMERAEYDLMASLEGSMWWYRALHTELLSRMNGARVPPGARVLDAGCGTGAFLAKLRA